MSQGNAGLDGAEGDLGVHRLPVPTLLASRLRLLGAYAATRVRRFGTRAALGGWQEQQVQRHLAWVAARSPFHAARFAGQIGRWREVPPVGKAEMMAHFDRFNTAGIRLDDALAVALQAEGERDFAPLLPGGIAVGLSSGTSGNRGVFLAGPAERDAWAGTMLAHVLPGALLGRHRVAFFLRANSALYSRLGSRRLQFQFFDLLDSPAQHVARLRRFQPTVLAAPPSMLRLLAEAQHAGRLSLAPAKVLSVAEVLDPVDRAVIEAAWGPVHEVYQATEGLLGVTCAHGTLHLCETHAVIEREGIGDPAEGRFTPVITDFRRRTQPILRHRLDDVLVLRPDPCPCGSVLTALARIEGRADDVFWLAGSHGRRVPLFPDFVRRAVLIGAPEADAYTATQTGPDAVAFALRLPDARRAEAEAGVRAAWDAVCARVGAPPPVLTFEALGAEAVGGAKRRRVVRAWHPGDVPVALEAA